jgi:MYXO-CTERM domain-containing protein
LQLEAAVSTAGRLVSLVLLWSLAACAFEDGEIGTDTAEVVNGTAVIDYPSAGALLFGDTPESSAMQCSGTLVGCDTFITAAHCVCDSSLDCATGTFPPSQLRVFFQHAGIYEVASVATQPGYQFASFGDIAVVRLTEPVVGVTPTPIITSNPSSFASMKIVGFGLADPLKQVLDFGIKREGDLLREPCGGFDDSEMLCFDPGVSPSVSCSGDSGGPNFIDIGGAFHLAGVVSGGGTQDSCTGAVKFATNVSGYLPFVEANAGALGGGTCGDLAGLADPSSRIETRTGLAAAAVYTIEVPPGTAELRVGANAMLGEFVSVAVSPDDTAAAASACEASGRMTAYCEINSPRPGVYQVAIDSDTEYQLAMTTLAGAPTAAADTYVATSREILEIDAEGGVLANDEPARGGTLAAEVVSQPENGVVLIAADGSFQYQSAEGFVGTDRFVYRALEDPYSDETEVVIEVVEESGCGCQTTSPRGAASTLLLALAALLLTRPRRRRRRGTVLSF